MQIDARERDIQELLREVRELLSSGRQCNMSVDILVKSVADAKKITGFVSMSGCAAEIDVKDNYCIIHVKGMPCCT